MHVYRIADASFHQIALFFNLVITKYFMIMICGLIFTIMIEFIIIIYKGLANPV